MARMIDNKGVSQFIAILYLICIWQFSSAISGTINTDDFNTTVVAGGVNYGNTGDLNSNTIPAAGAASAGGSNFSHSQYSHWSSKFEKRDSINITNKTRIKRETEQETTNHRERFDVIENRINRIKSYWIRERKARLSRQKAIIESAHLTAELKAKLVKRLKERLQLIHNVRLISQLKAEMMTSQKERKVDLHSAAKQEIMTFLQSVDPCTIKPCHHGGICEKKGESEKEYKCICPKGRRGKHCEDIEKENLQVTRTTDENGESSDTYIIIILGIMIPIILVVVIAAVYFVRKRNKTSVLSTVEPNPNMPLPLHPNLKSKLSLTSNILSQIKLSQIKLSQQMSDVKPALHKSLTKEELNKLVQKVSNSTVPSVRSVHKSLTKEELNKLVQKVSNSTVPSVRSVIAERRRSQHAVPSVDDDHAPKDVYDKVVDLEESSSESENFNAEDKIGIYRSTG